MDYHLSNRKSTYRFDYLRKLFSSENRAELYRYVAGSMKGPVVVDFDPTTACNFTCPECISAGLLNKESISADRISTLLDEFKTAGVKGVVFIGGGEPLAHKCMPMPLKKAHELGLLVGLTTNGSFIDRYKDAITECVAWTRVSIDAGSPETFQVFRPNRMKSGFATILSAMESLARVKKGALGYSFLMMSRESGGKVVSNIGEISEACRIARDIGCDYFEIKPMFNMDHELIPYIESLEATVTDQISAAKSLETESFKVITTNSIRQISERSDLNQEKKYNYCPVMSFRTTVTPSGIYPCAYHRGNSRKSLGMISDVPFDKFWSSDERKSAASLIDPSRDCKFYCARHKMNLVLHAISELAAADVDLLAHLREEDIDDVFF